ncbi:MAG: TRAP transporter small permease subunit [Oscillospiraceae bacterium]
MKIIRKITDVARWLVMIAVVFMMMITVVDVVLRKFFLSPILGVTEYSQMIMVVILLAAASTGMADGHIKVDLVTSRLPKKVQTVLEIITLILTFGTSLLMSTSVAYAGIKAINSGLKFLTVKISQAPFILLYALGLLILAIAAICLLVEAVRRLKKHE